MKKSDRRTSDTPGALDGLTVIDLTRVLSGPYCTMMLADMGARVIKVEQPGRGDDTRAWGPPFQNGESAYFLSINRNKESVTLNLKHPEGRRVLDALIERADVLVENFRPGTLERMGLGYADLAQQRPDLVYCSISGFGQTGPRRREPGYDAVMQGEGGLMSITGAPDGPGYRLGIAIVDIASGMFSAYGIAVALLARERTGRGQYIDVGMLDSVAALLTYQAGIHFTTGEAPGRLGNRHPSITPYETLEAADGELVVAAGNDQLWRTFCGVIGAEALADDARFRTNKDRVAARDDAAAAPGGTHADAAGGGVDRTAQDGGDPLRRGARPGAGVHRSAAYRARDGGGARPSGGRRHPAAWRADQDERHAGRGPHAAARARPAHRGHIGRARDERAGDSAPARGRRRLSGGHGRRVDVARLTVTVTSTGVVRTMSSATARST